MKRLIFLLLGFMLSLSALAADPSASYLGVPAVVYKATNTGGNTR